MEGSFAGAFKRTLHGVLDSFGSEPFSASAFVCPDGAYDDVTFFDMIVTTEADGEPSVVSEFAVKNGAEELAFSRECFEDDLGGAYGAESPAE